MNTSSLTFRWRDRILQGDNQTPRRFLDFEVDGVSLYDELRGRNYDYIGCLGDDSDYAREAFRRITLREPPDPWFHNPELYVCPECNDLGCGAITVKVERSDGFVTWREFVAEMPMGPLDRPRDSVDPSEYQVVEGLGPYHFAEGTYAEALAHAMNVTKAGS